MARMRFAAAILLIVAVFCGGYVHAADNSDLQHLIDMLGSDDFETREKASAKLERRGPEIWAQLQKLSESKDVEVQMRARNAMRALTRKALDEARKELEGKIKGGDALLEEFKGKLERISRETLDVYRKTYAARTELEKSKNPSEEIQTRGGKAQSAYDAELKIYRFAREALDQCEERWPRERSRLKSRISLYEELIQSGELIPPTDVSKLSPSALPFTKRLEWHITLQFKDVPLERALKEFTDASGISVELSPDLTPADVQHVTLEIFDADAEVVIKWICQAGDVELNIDKEKQKVVVRKK